ncbi:hypothetical protein Tco_0005438 [Tanacetum coccineum]
MEVAACGGDAVEVRVASVVDRGEVVGAGGLAGEVVTRVMLMVAWRGDDGVVEVAWWQRGCGEDAVEVRVASVVDRGAVVGAGGLLGEVVTGVIGGGGCRRVGRRSGDGGDVYGGVGGVGVGGGNNGGGVGCGGGSGDGWPESSRRGAEKWESKG